MWSDSFDSFWLWCCFTLILKSSPARSGSGRIWKIGIRYIPIRHLMCHCPVIPTLSKTKKQKVCTYGMCVRMYVYMYVCSWFHANVPDLKTAEALLLKQGFDGSYLARRSKSTKGAYSLSVRSDCPLLTFICHWLVTVYCLLLHFLVGIISKYWMYW